MTRAEFVERVSELLSASQVADASRLINLLHAHLEGEFAPGCGALSALTEYQRRVQLENNEKPTIGVCDRPVGHEGFHKDRHGHGWMNYSNGGKS